MLCFDCYVLYFRSSHPSPDAESYGDLPNILNEFADDVKEKINFDKARENMENKFGHILTEDEVISEEKRKIQEVLRNQFSQIEASGDEEEEHEILKDQQKRELMSDEFISQTFDEIKNYQEKEAKRTKSVKKQEHSRESKDEL